MKLTVSWSEDEVSHLIVFIVKPFSTLHGVYLVEDLATRELTLDQIDDERPNVLVYGLTVPDVRQTLRMFQIVNSGNVSVDRWTGGLFSVFPEHGKT